MASITEENYLKTLYYLSNEAGEVNLSDLSKSLEVKAPTANSMVKRLSEKGRVAYRRYQPLLLTELGKLDAALIIRRHRLAEMYLAEKMGFGWEEVHAIAEQMEHLKCPEFFDRMDELLGFPKIDPHGSPIPRKDGSIPHRPLRKLHECQVGERVSMEGLAHSSEDFLQYLNQRELRLGQELEILSKEAFDGSMTVCYPGHERETFSKTVCQSLLVE